MKDNDKKVLSDRQLHIRSKLLEYSCKYGIPLPSDCVRTDCDGTYILLSWGDGPMFFNTEIWDEEEVSLSVFHAIDGYVEVGTFSNVDDAELFFEWIKEMKDEQA